MPEEIFLDFLLFQVSSEEICYAPAGKKRENTGKNTEIILTGMGILVTMNYVRGKPDKFLESG